MSKKFRKIIALLLLSFIFLSMLFSYEVHADGNKQRVYDHANLLTDKEVKDLEKLAAKYSKKRKADFIIVTVDDSGEDLQIYMDDFYDEEEFGYDKSPGPTAMIGLDMKERDVILSGYKELSESLDPDRLDSIREKITGSLSSGNYYDAFESFIKLSAKFMRYKPGVDPEDPLYNSWIQLLIAVGIGIATIYMMKRKVVPKTTTTSSTYRDMDQTKILNQRDRYIRTTVTKRRKPKQSSSGGGGSSGGSIGRTSGGHARSSSRGKF